MKPADIAKEKQQPGALVQLGDGNEWLVPFAGTVDLAGETVPDKPGYIRFRGLGFARQACEWRKRIAAIDDAADSIELPAGWEDYCYLALSFNYDLTREVFDDLKLVDHTNVLRLILTTLLIPGEIRLPDVADAEPSLTCTMGRALTNAGLPRPPL